MKRRSVFRIPHIQGVYPMPYRTFCISNIETWEPARMIRINKFVPFEGLKLRSPSEPL